MELLWAAGAYTRGFREWLRRQLGWRLEVPHHLNRQLWRYGLEEKPLGAWSWVLPRRERVAPTGLTDITLNRGEAHPEIASGFALTHAPLLHGLNHFPTQIF
jgi:hypothetical protein